MASQTKNKHAMGVSVDKDVYNALHTDPYTNYSALINALLREIMEQKGML